VKLSREELMALLVAGAGITGCAPLTEPGAMCYSISFPEEALSVDSYLCPVCGTKTLHPKGTVQQWQSDETDLCCTCCRGKKAGRKEEDGTEEKRVAAK